MLDPDISTNGALANLTGIEADEHALDRRRFLQLIGMGRAAQWVTEHVATADVDLILKGQGNGLAGDGFFEVTIHSDNARHPALLT